MSYTQAQKKATQKYLSKLKSISIRISEEDYERYKRAIDNSESSLRSFIIQAIEEKIKRDSLD